MSIKTSKETWVNTGMCPICDRSRERDKALADQKAVLLAACKEAVSEMGNDPINANGEWETGMMCGLEDRGINDRYEACWYGYARALEKVQEWIIDSLQEAVAKATE